MTDETKARVDGIPIGSYRNWNMFRMLWVDPDCKSSCIKIAATRYDFSDFRSPVVHSSFELPDDDGAKEASCLASVMEHVDQIEDEGLEAFMDRAFPEWRNAERHD